MLICKIKFLAAQHNVTSLKAFDCWKLEQIIKWMINDTWVALWKIIWLIATPCNWFRIDQVTWFFSTYFWWAFVVSDFRKERNESGHPIAANHCDLQRFPSLATSLEGKTLVQSWNGRAANKTKAMGWSIHRQDRPSVSRLCSTVISCTTMPII